MAMQAEELIPATPEGIPITTTQNTSSMLAPTERDQEQPEAILYKRIDHILYTQWDPIGVCALEEEFDCSDEYRAYVPKIVKLVMEGATLQAVSDQMYEYESYIDKETKIRRRCDVIAAMVSCYGPHAAKLINTPVIQTGSTAEVYESVFDLLTQTRLDAYESRWADVCTNYRKVIELCSEFLPMNRRLRGICLNNLGVAYSHAGELEKSREAYVHAMPDLEYELGQPEVIPDIFYTCQNSGFPLAICLKNLINNMSHAGDYIGTLPFYKQLIAAMLSQPGYDDDDTQGEKNKINQILEGNFPTVKLSPRRISIYGDGVSVIGNFVVID